MLQLEKAITINDLIEALSQINTLSYKRPLKDYIDAPPSPPHHSHTKIIGISKKEQSYLGLGIAFCSMSSSNKG